MRVARTETWFVPIMGILVGTAWAALWLWEQSPYGRYLDHGRWTEIGLAANICDALPAGHIVLPALLYVVGWMLMSAAMMLPTTLPLLGIFGRLTERRPDRTTLLSLGILGYLLIWGRRLIQPLGVGLLAVSGAIVAQHIWSWPI